MRNVFSSTQTKILAALAGVLFIMTITAVGGYFIFFSQSKSITLINFVGKTKAEIIQWRDEVKLEEKRLNFISEYDEAVEKDIVLKQNFEEKHILQSSETLEITLSNGPDPDKEFEVPAFKNMTMQEIQKWFDERKFSNVSFSFEDNKDIKKDIFVKMTPTEKNLKRSDKINIVISSNGDDPEVEITIPDFSSYSRKNIEAWAKENRITLSFLTSPSNKVESGKVISQSIKAGNKIKKNTKLTVTLSSGKEIAIENFIGKKKEEVDAWAKKNAISIKFEFLYSQKNQGTVLEQSLTKGTIQNGKTIIFKVSAGMVKIPDFKGYQQSKVEDLIRGINNENGGSAKIALHMTQQESDQQYGTVISQNIVGEVAPGTTVNITVSAGKQVVIKNFAGKSQAEFLKYLKEIKMQAGTATSIYSDKAKDTIITNKEGKFPTGTAIDYTISLGEYIPRADLYATGASYQALVAEINNSARYQSGWSCKKVDVKSSEQAVGNIVKCTVNGKTISCEVSSGVPIQTVKVPNVIGKTEDVAKAELIKIGLTVTVINDYDATPAGTIIAQNIQANTSVNPGQAIIITRSNGPKPTPTPEPTPKDNRINLPSFPVGLIDGTYEQIRDKAISKFTSLGFTNIKVIDIATGGDSGNNVTTIDHIEPEPNGQLYGKDDEIKIFILKGEDK